MFCNTTWIRHEDNLIPAAIISVSWPNEFGCEISIRGSALAFRDEVEYSVMSGMNIIDIDDRHVIAVAVQVVQDVTNDTHC